MISKSNRVHSPQKLQNLALAAQEDLKTNTGQTRAFPALLEHPYLKRNLEIALKQNHSRLQNNLIPLPEAKLHSAQLVAQLLTNYRAQKGAQFKTYFCRYLPFMIKKSTRKSRGEKNWQNLRYYSENKERELAQLQSRLAEATKHKRPQKIDSLNNQLQFLASDYDNYRSKQCQKASCRNPAYQYASKKKRELQSKIIAQLKQQLQKIKQPLERICKQTWLDIFLDKTSCQPYVTKDRSYKIKPAKLMTITLHRLEEQGHNVEKFKTLSQRGKYKRLQSYIKQIKASFEKILNNAKIDEWKLKLQADYWSDRLLAQYE